jgi:hypothetical protein
VKGIACAKSQVAMKCHMFRMMEHAVDNGRD